MTSWIRYANQGATRSLPLDNDLAQALSYLQELGVTAEVFSGGQPAQGSGLPRVGSTRHDHGNAADVFFYQGDRRLDWANPQDLPVFQQIVQRGRAAGLTGFGAGPGYMQPGSMHVGFGAPGVWGAGGKGANAPDWLRAAFEGAPASTAPVANSSQSQMAVSDMFTPPAAPTGAPSPQVNPAMQTPTLASLALAAFQPAPGARQRQQAERQAEEEARRTALLSGIGSMYG